MSNMAPLTTGVFVDTNRRYLAMSIEHAFAWMKFEHTNNYRIASLERTKFVIDTTTGDVGEYAELPAIGIKKHHGRAAMKRAGILLDVKQWNQARREAMKSLLLKRAKVDKKFAETLANAHNNNLEGFFHFERSGPKSFWGGSFAADKNEALVAAKKNHALLTTDLVAAFWRGKNVLGELMSEVAAILATE